MDGHGGDDIGTGNDPLDQAEWDYCAKSGYDPAGDFVDEYELEARAATSRREFRELLACASPQEKVALKAALARLRSGKELNWEELARDLGKSSGAVKAQIRRAAAKRLRRKG